MWSLVGQESRIETHSVITVWPQAITQCIKKRREKNTTRTGSHFTPATINKNVLVSVIG